MNGSSLNEKIASPKGQIAKWLAAGIADRAIVDQLFLTAVSRHANPKEMSAVLDRIRPDAQGARAQVFQDTLWALVNSKEFIYNH
jgi:hypothetical protein